ncbi:MAG: hypothetical protein K0R88_2574 [Solirubrobacterales bacterium]|jgi:hypothetical protein|nr:hypothetical protein [Solirubrobacterales bacterium]
MESMRLRLGLIIAGLASLVLAVGFIQQAPWAIDLWPWETSPLSYIFIASILAAIALPVLWIGISGELAAMQAGAIDLAITYGGAFAYLLTLLGDAGQPELWPYVVVFGVGFAAIVVTFARTRRLAWRDPRPMPAPVRISFAAFAVMLIGAGTALVFEADIFPWVLDDESSVMFGLIYLGAAAYFITGFLNPRWPNAAGQLIGFLAYDLILIGPFVDRFGEVSGGELTSLIVYTAFVVYSGALAAYYLFAHPQTRLRIS